MGGNLQEGVVQCLQGGLGCDVEFIAQGRFERAV